MNRLLISGTNSGCGKTTVTCAVLSALNMRGITPAAFKCGPDYIDLMFHRIVTGIPSYNLDPFFLEGEGLRSHLSSYLGDIAVIEGAMGYYDGIAATDKASAYTVASETKTPVVLVLNAKGLSASLGAVIKGFTQYRKHNNICGVIFNNANGKRYSDLKKIASEAGVCSYGFMPYNTEWVVPNRHLGLLTVNEITDIKKIITELGKQAEQTLDIDGIIDMAVKAPKLAALQKADRSPCKGQNLRLAVARDEAFCFIYEENLELLKALGCELVFFSPMHDDMLPANINGLYLCGGYPELYGEVLAKNTAMRKSIQKAVKNRLPTIAEGGGFMYLHDTLDGKPMCGVIAGKALKTTNLQRFGYITLTARHNNLLCKAGESIRSHEFHYWDSTNTGEAFTAKKAGREITYGCIHATDTLYAGFPHLFFSANPLFAKRFAEGMLGYEG